MNIEVRRLTGREVLESLSELARLRIEVFREYPYLYEGSEEAEEAYLSNYAEADGAVVVRVRHGDEVVGVSTGMPLAVADVAFRRPFEDAGEVVGDWFYFGESVLRKGFRGQGIGHRFFDEREAHATGLGYRKLAFCSVVRADDHALRPMGYRPHDVFWTKRGFIRRPGLRASLKWAQVDSAGKEVGNELVFWTRETDPDPRQM